MMSERFTAWTLSLAQRDGILAMLFVFAACLVFAFALVYSQLDDKSRALFTMGSMATAFVVFYGALIALVTR